MKKIIRKILVLEFLVLSFGMGFWFLNPVNAANANQQAINQQINSYPKEPLSDAEKKSLLLMREEEKLAHDVYITLYNQWNLNIFRNIASSEETHMQSVLTLLAKYGIGDPVGNNGIGIFENQEMQVLYKQLVDKGVKSLLDALIVGATIEDLDIYDLNNALKYVDNQDITFVYENLSKGSRNHLRSFYLQIVKSKGSYSAQYITQSELEAIVNSPKETNAW